MFSYELIMKCDICQRKYRQPEKDLSVGQAINLVMPPAWRSVLIEGDAINPKRMLVCDDHKEPIGLVAEKEKE